jgi:DNA-binding NarL/FixJ family response regulator
LLSTEYCETVVALGIPEFVGVTCPTGTGSALVIGARYDEPYVVPTAERAYWHAIAHHFASGLRLREVVSRPIDAVFRVDEGSPVVEHLSPDAALPSHREALRAAAIRREESRRGRRSDHEAAWPALIAGRWTLIDRFEEHGRRYLLAVRNPAGPSGGPRLDQRETAVIDAVARGEANKSIAIDLGMSEATISRAVRTALRKLGIAIADLIAARNAFTAPISLRGAELDVIPLASAASWIEELTPGERASVGGVLRGHSTATIARGRGVSKRTVTNQLASAFEKLGVRSRRELILLLSR